MPYTYMYTHTFILLRHILYKQHTRMFKSYPKKWEGHIDPITEIKQPSLNVCFLEVCMSSQHVKVIVSTHMRIHGPLFILNMKLKTIFEFTV